MTTNEIIDELLDLGADQESKAAEYKERATVCRRLDQPDLTRHYDKRSAIAARRAEALEAAMNLIRKD
jgi:hypothetical protein